MAESGGITRRHVIGAAAAGAAALVGLRAADVIGDGGPSTGDLVVATRSEGPLPLEDPGNDDGWGGAVRIPLTPQQAAPPILTEGTISDVVLQARHNGEDLGFRLRWSDPERDDLAGLAEFTDAVALQLPARAGARPPITMGGPGAPVHVLQWRALWQRDIASGRTGVDDRYPNVVRDVDPDELLGDRVGRLFAPGLAVGNPLSARTHDTPVEEMVAEGFGSLTHLSAQRARGAGVWDDGHWTVTIGFPMAREGVGDPIYPDIGWPVGIAVWAGSAGNRGGRKHFADWIALRLA